MIMSGKPKYKITKEFLHINYIDENKSTIDIALMIGCSVNTVNFWIKKHDLKMRGKGTHRIKNIVGKEFNNWTVLSRVESDPKTKCSIWLCRCKCGVEKTVHYGALTTGQRKQCRKCSALSQRSKDALTFTFWNKIIQGAQQRNLLFDITREYAYDLFLEQGEKCSLTGLDLTFSDTTISFNGTASLDRKDSKFGYTKDNIQWVHKDVNRMKWKHKELYFVDLCRIVVQHYDQKF